MSFLFDWFWDLLGSFGLFNKDATVLLLGLDNAGKTTLLHKLKSGAILLFMPTERARMEEVVFGNITMRAWDLGGHHAVRTLWTEYYEEADAIIFVIDCADRDRIEEARFELHAILDDPELQNIRAVLVLANKVDLEGHMKEGELLSALDMESLVEASADFRKVNLCMCSLVEGTGFEQAFRWLEAAL